jgi:hypothetical protein
MKRLATMTGLVAVSTVVFSRIGGATEDVIDPLILSGIAVTYTLGIVVMLAYTRKWNTIGAGLLATMTGDALLYGHASRQLPMPEHPLVLDMARSCFIVGGLYLLAGLLLWVKDQRNGDALLLTDDVP